MLNKFKEELQHYFMGEARQRKIEFQNKNIKIHDEEYLICRAVVSAIPEMIDLQESTYHYGSAWSQETFHREIVRADSLYLLVRHDDELIAFVGCKFDPRKKESHISSLVVASNFQRRGIATYLLTELIQNSIKQGDKEITLEVAAINNVARALYEKLGFIQGRLVANYYRDTNEDAYEYYYDCEGRKEK